MIGRNVTALTALMLFSTLTASAKTYSAERYLVNLNLNQQGTLDVTETVKFNFYGGPFTFVYRDIAAAETDGISDIEASIDDRPCALGTGPGEVEIRGPKVRWHLASFSGGSHTFKVHYRAAGVIRKSENGDTLIWHVLPDKRSYPIQTAELLFGYPANATANSILLRPNWPVLIKDGSASSIAYEVRHTADAIVTATFPKGTFSGPAPRWWSNRKAGREAFRNAAGIATLVALIALFAAWSWLSGMRSTWPQLMPTMQNPTVVTRPPSSLAPALAARLIKARGGIPGMLMDLARRGAIRIEETKAASRWTGRSFQIIRQQTGLALAPHERIFFANMLNRETISLARFQRRAAQSASKFSKAVAEELDAAGLFHTGRREQRKRLHRIGGLFFAAALILGGLALAVHWQWMALAGVLTVAAVASAICMGMAATFASRISPYTEAGVVAAAQWKSYAAYLREMSRGGASLPGLAEWELILPYAAAFAIAAPLVKFAQRQGQFVSPLWFAVWDQSGGDDSFVAFVTTGDAGGYSGGGDGGGGGASGGGDSGAG